MGWGYFSWLIWGYIYIWTYICMNIYIYISGYIVHIMMGIMIPHWHCNPYRHSIPSRIPLTSIKSYEHPCHIFGWRYDEMVILWWIYGDFPRVFGDFMVNLWWSNGGLMVIYWPIYPLVMADIAIEHVTFSSLIYPAIRWWFSIAMLVYQRLCENWWFLLWFNGDLMGFTYKKWWFSSSLC